MPGKKPKAAQTCARVHLGDSLKNQQPQSAKRYLQENKKKGHVPAKGTTRKRDAKERQRQTSPKEADTWLVFADT